VLAPPLIFVGVSGTSGGLTLAVVLDLAAVFGGAGIATVSFSLSFVALPPTPGPEAGVTLPFVTAGDVAVLPGVVGSEVGT
jgi:hypothetical protein